MTPRCHSLFVYGTLRRRSGHPMARWLAERATFIAEAVIAGRLYDLGPYPGVVPSSADGEVVHGDLYEFDGDDLFPKLDSYEAADPPVLFARRMAEATPLHGEPRGAWVYWWHGPLPETAKWIESGHYTPAFPARPE